MVQHNIKVKYVLSEHLRHGTKTQKEALLEWVSQPEFKDKRPTVAELIAACKRRGPLFGLMKVGKSYEKEAAEQYWRQTAQDILRHINVVRVNISTGKVLTEPIVSHIALKRGQYGRIDEDDYIPAQRVADDSQLRKSVLDSAYADLVAWKQRYERYAEFMDKKHVIAAYAQLKKELAKNLSATRHKAAKKQKAA